jgi:sigma-B regulation protein RsbU (phosphoserine phosphatase)
MFVTVFYGILNINSGVITYSNAGHNPPMLIKSGGDTSFVSLTNDMILGAVEGAVYHEKEIQLSRRDTLLLYTDGVTEAQDTNREWFGEKRLLETCLQLAGRTSKNVVEQITGAVSDFSAGSVQSDDITVLSISYRGT